MAATAVAAAVVVAAAIAVAAIAAAVVAAAAAMAVAAVTVVEDLLPAGPIEIEPGSANHISLIKKARGYLALFFIPDISSILCRELFAWLRKKDYTLIQR